MKLFKKLRLFNCNKFQEEHTHLKCEVDGRCVDGSIPVLKHVHRYLYDNVRWYKQWHHHPYRCHFHSVSVVIFAVLIALQILLVFGATSGSTLASMSAYFTNNEVLSETYDAHDTDKLVLDIIIPDAWNGGIFIPDTIVEGGSESIWQGDVTHSIPILGSPLGVGFIDGGKVGFQGSGKEAVIRDLDADGVYTSNADILIDGDGSESSGSGSVDVAATAGDVLVAMGNDIATGGLALCSDNLKNPTAVRIDTDGTCDNGTQNEGIYVLGTSETLTINEVDSTWSFGDAITMRGNANGTYDDGEDIFTEETSGSLTYSDSADDNVYGTPKLKKGNILIDFAADCDGAGSSTQSCVFTGLSPLNATSSILIDEGTKGGVAPNGVVDIQEDQFTGIGVQNIGTAVDNTDISSVKVWMEQKTEGFQSNKDILFGIMTVNSADAREWRLGGLTQAVNAGGLHIYVTVDISANPTEGATLQFQIPVFNDVGNDGVLTQNNDRGVFVLSDNSGPTDTAVVNSNIQTIGSIDSINSIPILTEVISAPSGFNKTPEYTFNTTIGGTITYGGDCSSDTTTAIAGDNTITFNTLKKGNHKNCTITVDSSEPLTITAFKIAKAGGKISALTTNSVSKIRTQTKIKTQVVSKADIQETEDSLIDNKTDGVSSHETVSGESTESEASDVEFVDDVILLTDDKESTEESSVVSSIKISSPKFTRILTRGNSGSDVKALQKFLNKSGFPIASNGFGSLGNETDYFGPLTEKALKKFQEAHSDEILDQFVFSDEIGSLGESTIEFIASLDEVNVINSDKETIAKIEKPNLIDDRATHSCSVTPFSQNITRGQSKTRVLKLQSENDNTPFVISVGELSRGLSVSFNETQGSGQHDINIELSAAVDAAQGSFNVIVIHEVTEDDGSTTSNICQFNVVVE
ncbi:hypothetical protein COB64_04220 [Candidatus Wolfebacteria bacterium]|nr:MAG: hypothetical protein COB64_04220 [Candidatus Wolfebacteria bacterium]